MVLSYSTSLSFSYFRKHLNRYIFLLISLSIGFAVITILSSLSLGMTKTLHDGARTHYGGDLLIISYDKDHGNKMHMSEPELVQILLDQSAVGYERLQKRVNYYREGTLYFQGTGVGQKNVYGVDWDNEDFSGLHIVEGSTEELNREHSIMISESVARELGCSLGDSIILQGNTLTGQKNAASLVVRAVFRDTSIFGYYKSYIPRDDLASLMGFSKGDISSFGLYREGGYSEDEILTLHTLLSEKLDTAPILHSKEDLTRELDKTHWTGQRYFIIPLGIYISQVDELLSAIDLVTYFLYTMVALIILVSVFVSYQLVIREREKEIATLRAIGMEQHTILFILMMESFWLYALGLLMGVILSLPGFYLLNLVDFEALPGFELFLNQGRLLPRFSWSSVLLNVNLLALILLPASLIPSYRASRSRIVEALN